MSLARRAEANMTRKQAFCVSAFKDVSDKGSNGGLRRASKTIKRSHAGARRGIRDSRRDNARVTSDKKESSEKVL